MNRLFVIIILLVLYYGNIAARVPVGAWRDHLSYNRASHVAVSDDKVYGAAGAGLIVFNKNDNSIEKLSKVHGLSDVDISTIKWSDVNGLLFVGYTNGNIDIIKGKQIINLSDILRSSISGSKSINNIMFVGSRAYLSCSFGIVVVNLERNEIADTYYLGEDGIRLAVNDMIFDGSFLYAATSAGLYRADINAPNLLDFSFWARLDFLPEANALFSSLAWFGEKLYAVQLDGLGNYVSYIIDGDLWEYFYAPSNNPMKFNVSGSYLTVVRESETDIFGSGPELLKRIDDYGFWGLAIRDVYVENEKNVWIADRIHGLVRNVEMSYDILTPPGPFSNRVFSISSYPERNYFAAGGYTAALVNLYQNGEYSILKDELWDSKLNYDIRDVLYVKEHPADPETHFLATWGFGLIEYREGEFHKRYGESNSSLRSIIPGDNFVRIGGIDFDKDNNLWVTNPGVPNPVSVRKPNGQWLSFPYGGLINHDHAGKLIVNRHDHKWVLLPRGGGLFVFENGQNLEETSDDQARKLSIVDENNDLISNEVFSIAEDKRGLIWVGINNGVVVYYNPSRVFSEEHFFARRIVIAGDRKEDFGYLLNNETVTAIAIDGADRKWFGTEKSGVFLVSADGMNQIHHFTRGNSPLLSNSITDISIDPSTGEVFIGTSRGIISFRGDATEPEGQYRNVYVFPNPVRENYEGPITVTGLIKDSVVKITDISGNLVYETISLGGQAIWNGRNSRGRRVQTGVYIVFISNPDGSETHVTKLMFIH